MGLDDIDDDVPSKPRVEKKACLDDLFGGLGVTQLQDGRHQHETASQHEVPKRPECKQDPLDSLFSGAPTAAQPAPNDDLFDFSKPVERKLHKDSNAFLDLFASGGKAPRESTSTLASVAAPSTSRVAAKFLSLMNYYDVLGVTPLAPTEEIKRQYKKKALELHPDKVGTAQTQEEADLFKMITKAHEVLTDESLRREYDSQLRGGQGQDNWLHHVAKQ